MAESQAELTPMQRYCYAMSKDYHTDTDVDKPQTTHAAQQGLHGL